ncbi:hypothetical protein [Paludisphaera soli]|uniref:hypothetical protein n=1 Tax=Paludisphaera soli TaxID=2712865 RepID=UPI0013EE3928|nr:hypothetical protein [Paludisphaera soli]
MDSFGPPWIWAQATGFAAPANPAATAYLALRRWCGGLTLSPSRPAPEWDVFLILGAAPLVLAVAASLFQGPGTTFRQVVDVFGHARLFREAVTRIWQAGRMVTILLTCTVLSWTGSQSLAFFSGDAERGRSDLLLLERSRGPVELILEHGAAAATTPLRDVAGLGDYLPLLVAAVVIVYSSARSRSSSPKPGRGYAAEGDAGSFDDASGWRSAVGACAILYVLYRLFARAAGGGELPVGNCLLLEVLIIPALMLACDGFLLAWILAELRDGGSADDQAGAIDARPAIGLMPAACVVCLAVLPARYAATLILLASQHLPATWMAGEAGRAVRWSLGPGLLMLQAGSLVVMGIAGPAAWGRGSIREAVRGLGRLLTREGGRLVVVAVVAALGCGCLSALAYAVLFLLPPAGWVLPAADAYAHYVSLPVGLWTLSALVQLGEQSLPTARLARDPNEVEPEIVPIRGQGDAAAEGSALTLG